MRVSGTRAMVVFISLDMGAGNLGPQLRKCVGQIACMKVFGIFMD